MADENGGNAALGGCIVVVDTRDKSGNDNSKMWTQKVEEMGAKVAAKVTDKVTHLVFRSGKKAVSLAPRPTASITLGSPLLHAPDPQTYDAAAAKGVALVDVSWITASMTEEERADVTAHAAKPPQADEAPQKAMEPVPVRVQEPPESSSQVRRRTLPGGREVAH